MAEILRIFISPEHNYFGHHGQEAGTSTTTEVTSADCVTGSGIVGDRFFGFKPDYKGQITFFEIESHEYLCRILEVDGPDPSVFRRNVLTRGISLNDLIGKRFTLQGILFEGSQEASPCYWMDQAFAPGAERALRGRGGLRARILSDGILQIGDGVLEVVGDAEPVDAE